MWEVIPFLRLENLHRELVQRVSWMSMRRRSGAISFYAEEEAIRHELQQQLEYFC